MQTLFSLLRHQAFPCHLHMDFKCRWHDPHKESIRQGSPKASKHKHLWSCLILAEHAAFPHRRTIPKACKVLTKSNHFIRHFEIFCYYSPERKGGEKKKKSNSHYNEQFRRWQKTCCGNKAQHKAPAHTEVNTASQLKLCVLEETFRPCFMSWLQRQHTSLLLHWICFYPTVCYHQWKNHLVIHAPDRFKRKTAKLLQCLVLYLLSCSLCLLLSDTLLPGDTNQCQFECPFWYSDFLSRLSL